MKPFELKVNSQYGAPMGRRCDNLMGVQGPIRLQRVPFVDGDYDPGGAYWGGGRGTLPLYCAWGQSADGEQLQYFVRAYDRDGAAAAILVKYPGLKFRRR